MKRLRFSLVGAALLLIGATRVLAQTGGVISVPETLPKMMGQSGAKARGGASGGNAPRAKFEPAGDGVYHGAGLPETWDDSKLRQQVQS